MKCQLKLSAVFFAGIAGFATPHAHAQTAGKYLAPRDQVVAIRAGRLFDARSGMMLTNQVVLVRGDRIADVGAGLAIPSGASVIDLSNATVMPGMIDAHVHINTGGIRRSPAHADRTRQCPDRLGRRLHHGPRYGFARRLQHGRHPRRDQLRPRPGPAHAGGGRIAQSSRDELLSGYPHGPLPGRLHRGQERQRSVARARRRAGSQAARRRLGENLHHAGFRRHHAHVDARREAGQFAFAHVRGGAGRRRRSAPARPQGRVPHLRRRRHGQLHQCRRGRSQSPARTRSGWDQGSAWRRSFRLWRRSTI